MPLSDAEQRVLKDIERGLNATDPTLMAESVLREPRSRTRRALTFGISVLTVGFALVLAGLVVNLILVSILGYLLMVAAIVLVTRRRSSAAWISTISVMPPSSREHPQE